MATAILSAAIVRRWLTAVALRASAGDIAARGTPVEAAAALVAADASSETALGILADLAGEASGLRDPHERLITLALKTAAAAGSSVPPDVLRAVRVSHGDRNRVVHHGQEPGPRMVEEALSALDSLLAVLAEVLPRLEVVPSGGGVASAVASLVDVPALSEQLRAGDAATAAGDVREALKACAIGHVILLGHAVPPLVSSARRQRRAGSFADFGSVEEAVNSHEERLTPLERWLVPMALATSPADYGRFRGLAGHAFRLADGWAHYLSDDPPPPGERTTPLPPLEDARWALAELSRISLRLWEMRALASGDADAVRTALRAYGA